MNILELFPPIRTFIFEMDHVLTDGHIGLGLDNQAVRSFFARDLYAIRKAVQQGYRVAVVAPEVPGTLPAVMQQSGITTIDNRDQLPVAAAATILYMNGLYTTTLPATQRILYCCPADAVPDVKAYAAYISPFNGGAGCAYDVIEKVLKLNHHW